MDGCDKRNEEGSNNQEVPTDNGQDNDSVSRRAFIRQAGQSGIAAGLASFMLVGGASKDSFAANVDNCVSPFKSGSSEGKDTCEPPSNDDECSAGGQNEPQSNYEDGGDECGTSTLNNDVCPDNHPNGQSVDLCATAQPYPYPNDECDPAAATELYDTCLAPWSVDPDVCSETGTAGGGDTCAHDGGVHTATDVCNADYSGSDEPWV